jgi:hypothetical protein
MALTVRAEPDLGAVAVAGFGVGEAGLLDVDGEAVRVGTGAATAVCEAGGLDETLGDGLEEECWDTGAVQATIQTSRTPARRPVRCGDIARKDNVPSLFAGTHADVGFTEPAGPRVLTRRLEGRLGVLTRRLEGRLGVLTRRLEGRLGVLTRRLEGRLGANLWEG